MRKLSNNPLREAILKCLVVGGMTAAMNVYADCNVIYGVHDEGLNNSQFVKIDRNTYAVTPLGEMHSGYDIEGLDMNAANELYGSSGDDSEGHPAGHLYKVNTTDGSVQSIGDICFDVQGTKVCGTEVSAISFNPINDSLWGWSEECGLVKVNPTSPENSTLEMPYSTDEFVACLANDNPRKRQRYTSTIEDLSWDIDGKKIYYANKDEIYVYQPIGGSIKGPLSGSGLGGNVETVEMLPDNDKALLLIVDGSPQLFTLDIASEIVSVIEESNVKPYTDIEAVAVCIDDTVVTCDEMGSSTFAKFNLSNGTYVADASAANNNSIAISGDETNGTWSATDANITHVVVNTTDATSVNGATNGTFNNADGITDVEFCGTFEEVEEVIVDCTEEEATNEWLYATDAVGDATGDSGLEIYGTAVKLDGDTVTVAITANMTPENPVYYNGENTNFTDYVFDFDGTKYAVHFAPDNDSGANAGVGLYEVTGFKDVTEKNYGWPSFSSYNRGNLGDLPIQNDYFSWDAQRSVPLEIASGTKVANDNFTRLNGSELAGIGLSFPGATGTYTFGFSFTKTANMEGDFVSYVFTECINDGIALVNTLPASMDAQSCPEVTPEPESTATDTDYVALINPSEGSATVDGDISEWNLNADFSANMCTAGSVLSDGSCGGNGEDKVKLSELYSRYDCDTNTMYVLVLENTPYEAERSEGDAWVTIGGNSNKVVKGSSGNNGTAPDFSWVENNSGRAIGYEASFLLEDGDVQVHLNVSNNTSSTGKNGDTARIIRPASCPAPVAESDSGSVSTDVKGKGKNK